jgi:hypothetical protein
MSVTQIQCFLPVLWPVKIIIIITTHQGIGHSRPVPVQNFWKLRIYMDIWWDSLDGGSARREASTYTVQHNTEKRGHTFIPRAGFEPAIPVFERWISQNNVII